MMLDLKAIDKDPDIIATVDSLGTLTQQIAKARREMTTAKKAIDGATKALGFIDQILSIVGHFVLWIGGSQGASPTLTEDAVGPIAIYSGAGHSLQRSSCRKSLRYRSVIEKRRSAPR